MDKNIKKTLTNATDSFYNCERTQAVVCRINRKKDIHKEYLFGEPQPDEHIQLIPTSYDFDEETNVYTTVVRHRKGTEATTRIAWVQL